MCLRQRRKAAQNKQLRKWSWYEGGKRKCRGRSEVEIMGRILVVVSAFAAAATASVAATWN